MWRLASWRRVGARSGTGGPQNDAGNADRVHSTGAVVGARPRPRTPSSTIVDALSLETSPYVNSDFKTHRTGRGSFFYVTWRPVTCVFLPVQHCLCIASPGLFRPFPWKPLGARTLLSMLWSLTCCAVQMATVTRVGSWPRFGRRWRCFPPRALTMASPRPPGRVGRQLRLEGTLRLCPPRLLVPCGALCLSSLLGGPPLATPSLSSFAGVFGFVRARHVQPAWLRAFLSTPLRLLGALPS